MDIVLFITARNVLLHNVMMAMSFCVPKQYYNDLLLTFFWPYPSLEEEDIIQLVHVHRGSIVMLSFLLSGTLIWLPQVLLNRVAAVPFLP